MAISEWNEPQKPRDIENLESEVALFASSIGLFSSVPSSGFNDSDFRLKPHRPSKPNSISSNKKPDLKREGERKHKSKNKNESRLSLVEDLKGFCKFSNMPKLPLMKASLLEVWYIDAEELEAKVIGEANKKLVVENVEEWKDLVARKRKVAERLLAQYTQDYESSKEQRGHHVKMLSARLKFGTMADKVLSRSALVGENPIANLKSLDNLLAPVTSKVGKRFAFMGFDSLRELFMSSLLPDRKLKVLLQRPLNNLPESKDGNSLLLFWYWEECLKLRYERFVIALEEASRDVLPELKDKALKAIYVLLRDKSEQERRLLSALVNKLGDPANKGASSAGYHLSNLLSANPKMKAVVIDEVDSFLFRPHLGLRAKYNAVNFLSQFDLSHEGDGPKVAKRLIDVYFALFKVLISEAGDGRKMEKSSKAGDGKASSSFKECKVKSPSEFHVELDSRLLSALLTGVNRAFPFVSTDEADDVIEVQTPMLFQLVHSKNFNVGVQALMLLDKISSKNQIVSDRFYRALYSKLLLPAAMNTSKAEMFIGLLQRAMKSDINLKRVAAFSKRLLQFALQQPAQYACACLLLLSEVLKARPPLWNMVLQNEYDDEDLEHFKDIEEEPDNKASTSSEKPGSDDGFVRNSNIDGHKSHVSTLRLPGGYNPRHREPSFCNANRVSWWELRVLASHVHPSVAIMARTLLCGVNIVYNGNPLNDLSLTAFLDKFMEKKPKPRMWHGGSQIEPAKKLDMNNHLIGAEILSLAEVDVPPEDFVFHKFYMNKMSSSKKPKKKKKKGPEDEAAEELFQVDAGGESDNEEIENMLDSVDPLLEREDGEYDYDDLDQVANEDDDDLVGDISDAEMDIPNDIAEGEDFDATADNDSSDDDSGGVAYADDGSDDEDQPDQRKRKRSRSGRKTGVSPFASLEDYEHLLNEDCPKKKECERKKPQSWKKRKSSD
ncbi:hypothetical protein L1049_007870 [Liquidambar formosana]|uniref:CCAAT-binding factor domain-containing protein n=1 Tax=Liquidambar formosana TaxID=63359 RepID=A0AAP0S8Y8_LIQFO